MQEQACIASTFCAAGAGDTFPVWFEAKGRQDNNVGVVAI